MSQEIESRLAELGIELPQPAAPAANYLPYLINRNTLFISGQLPFGPDGALLHKGLLGAGVSIEEGQAAARQCAINILAQAKSALGSLERIRQCLRLTGYVASTADFTDQPKVINGASDLMVEVLGDMGRHTRAAVGNASLPLGTPVEVDAMFDVD